MARKKKQTKTWIYGAARQYVESNFHLPSSGTTEEICLNGHIFLLFLKNEQSLTRTAEKVFETFGKHTKVSHIKQLLYKSQKWVHGFTGTSQQQSFEEYCKKPFVKFVELSSFKESTQPPVLKNIRSTSMPTSISAIDNGASSDFVTPVSPVQCSSTRSIMTPRRKKLKHRLCILSAQIATSAKKQKYNIESLKHRLSNMPERIRVLQQKVKRKDDIIKRLKEDISELKKINHINYLEKIKDTQKILKEKERNKLQLLKTNHNKMLKEKEMAIASLEDEMFQFQLEENKVPFSEDDKTYSVRLRLLIYNMLTLNVPTSNVPCLIEKVGDFYGFKFNKIPHRTTVEQMARELGVVSDLIAAEVAISTKNLTLEFDATTQAGMHVNCVNVTTKDKCYVLAVDQLPGGTAVDYENHICSTIDHEADIYSNFHRKDFEDTRRQIINNITNSLCDRAPVNHATIEKVCQNWGKTLNELNCHLHPLDSIASSCRQILRSLESEPNLLYGKDCLAAKIVLSINKLRYKDGKGDPKSFINFLDANKLPRGIIPRYRGNRLHIIFHTCGVLVQNYFLFQGFFSSGAISCKKLQKALESDFNSKTAIKEIFVLAVLGKLLTGPWMSKFYVSESASINHLEAIECVKNVLKALEDCKMNPVSMFGRKTDFFGSQIELSFPSLCDIDDHLISMTIGCLSAVICVLKRQYDKYFSMTVTSVLQKETETARLHNIDCEEIMGMFSSAKEKSPNATMSYLSSKLKAKKNNTLDFLEQLEPSNRERVIKWSIQEARKGRHQYRLKMCELRSEIFKRITAKCQFRDEKEKKKLEQELSRMSVEDMMAKYSHLSTKQLSDLQDVMLDKVVGRKLCHEWYDEATQKTDFYSGRVEKVKRANKDIVYVISYWSEDAENEAVDYRMKKFQLAADVVNGELIFS